MFSLPLWRQILQPTVPRETLGTREISGYGATGLGRPGWGVITTYRQQVLPEWVMGCRDSACEFSALSQWLRLCLLWLLLQIAAS